MSAAALRNNGPSGEVFKGQSKMIRTATSYLFGMFIPGEMFAAASTTVSVPDKTIASIG
jgi:hypothetical protein